MQVIIDRFEGDYAVCEKYNKEMIDIPKCRLPENAKEGDVLNISDDNMENITIDKEKTDARKKHIEEITKKLWE